MKIYAQIGLLIFTYYIVYYTYSGLLSPIPALGDSWDYHIPISQFILNGTFLTLRDASLPQQYYPGSSEAINSLLLFLHIPLTVSNILAVIILFFVCIKLGLTFRLKYYSAIFFATTICTLNVIVRWYNAVSIDIWITIFYLLSIILLQKPMNNKVYMLKLGFVLGMLIGSKYTGCFLLVLLLIVYWKSFYELFNLKNIIIFLVPFSLFGLFWYIRNYFLMQNPVYPLSLPGFNGINTFTDNVWSVTLKYPYEMFNAFYGEYNLWFVAVILLLGFYFYRLVKKPLPKIFGLNRLIAIGLLGLLLYFTFPTSSQPWIMVSSLRYSYSAFIPLILCVFLIVEYYRKKEILGFIALGNMLMVVSMTFYPKLTIIYIFLAFLGMFLLQKFYKQNM